MNGRIILVGGGARSGKSAFALARARALGERRAFVATALAFDDEMRARIARHQSERGGAFVTVEASVELVEALTRIERADVVVIDCLTLWLSNLLLRGETEAAMLARVDELSAVLGERRFHAVLVTNEVGMGVVPESRLGRAFRDVAGLAHQRLSRRADEVVVAMVGSVLRIKPAPVALADAGGPNVDAR